MPLGVALLCLLLAAGGEPVRETLRFERTGLADGQVWRLLTGHFVHLGWPHTALNVAALGAVAMLFMNVMTRRDWLLGTLAAIAAIDTGLFWLAPRVGWYVGLSGALHGLVLIGAARLWNVQRGLASLVLAGLAVKLCWEALAGPSPWSEAAAGGPVVVAAHLYGTAGAAVYLAPELVRRARQRPL